MVAQRNHVIHSLDSLCFQFATVSFLLSPSIWLYLARCTLQVVLTRPRDVDATKPLAWWLGIVLAFNTGSLWTHAMYGAAETSGVMLDFVGISYKPSSGELLILDAVIITLQALLATIAFICSVEPHNEDDGDAPDDQSEPIYILDLKFKTVRAYLWTAPPPSSRSSSRTLSSAVTARLPVGNTLQTMLRNRRERAPVLPT